MSNLSELLPAGAGAKSADFVASGTLGSGITVALKADGTVTAVSSEGTPSEAGSSQVFDSTNSANWTSIAYDPNNNKVVVIYGVGSFSTAEPRAVVGTISGTSISFGTPVPFDTGTDLWTTTIAYDSAQNKFLIAYSDYANNFYGYVIVGTVSGNSISFGTRVAWQSNQVRETQAVYNPVTSLTTVAFSLNNTSGRVSQFIISGTTASSPALNSFESGRVTWVAVTYDSTNNKIIIFYSDNNNSNRGTVVVGTPSGSNLTFGTPYVLSGQVSYTNCAFDPDTGKVIIVYNDDASPNGKAAVGTVSGTSISFGTPVVYNSGTTWISGVDYDSYAKKIVVAYRDNSDGNKGKVLDGAVSGTTISFGASTTFKNNQVEWLRTAYDPSSQATAIIYGDANNSYYGTSNVYKAPSSNVGDFIGITDQAIADTATGAVIVQGGVSDKLSGLTVGADYYVQDDGSLSSPTAPDPYNLSNAVYDEVSFSVSGQAATPTAMRFNDDGTKMYVADFSGTIYQYSLSEAFNITTAAYASISYSVSGQESSPRGLAFNDDGTKMFVVGSSATAVLLYNLGSAFNISTASYSSTSFSVSAIGNPISLAFSVDGTEMYVTDNNTTDSAHQYSLSTGWDITTASFTSSFTVSSQDGDPTGITFNSDGTQMYVAGQGTDAIYQYNLSTAYSVSSAVYSGTSLSVAAQDIDVGDVVFSSTGAKMYIVGYNTDAVYQYSLNGSTSTVPAGKALSSTSILLEG